MDALNQETEKVHRLLRKLDQSDGEMCSPDTVTAIVSVVLNQSQETNICSKLAVFIVRGILVDQASKISEYDVEHCLGRMSSTFWLANKSLRKALITCWKAMTSTDQEEWNGRCAFGCLDINALMAANLNSMDENNVGFIMPNGGVQNGYVTSKNEESTLECRITDSSFTLNKVRRYRLVQPNKVQLAQYSPKLQIFIFTECILIFEAIYHYFPSKS